jgi:hypothetical protein
MIQAGEKISSLYGHWFDLTIVNGDLSLAFEELVIKKLSTVIDAAAKISIDLQGPGANVIKLSLSVIYGFSH